MRDEGYIKFNCTWNQAPAPAWHKIRALAEWRQVLFDAGLIGMYSDGIGFGNISIRDSPADHFLITGSATGGLRLLRPEHFTRVTAYDLGANSLTCSGRIKASSESLTHAAFYETSRSIGAVVHVHHRGLWEKYLGKLPTTSSQVAYGTPEMALEVKRLLQTRTLSSQKQLVVMGGHEEGVMAYGSSISHAASILLNCCDNLFRKK